MEQSNKTLTFQTPLLIIPKQCTALETNYKVSDNVLIDLNITSQDTEGHQTCIYNGLCNVKLIENYEVDIQVDDAWPTIDDTDVLIESAYGEHFPVVLSNPNILSNTLPNPDLYNQNQVWIDPSRSPYVYNQCDVESYDYSVNSIHAQTNHITVEQHHTYITQNVYNYKEQGLSSPTLQEQALVKEINRRQDFHSSENQKGSDLNVNNLYEDDEFACGVFLSQLQDEIINEKKTKAREESKYIDLNSDNNALKQLMSSDIQSISKQRKTILFLGHDSHCGQTIQKIAVNDPSLECASLHDHNMQKTPLRRTNPNQKRYQCDKCKQIFDKITAFKQHMVNHKGSKIYDSKTISDVKFMCAECGKSLKTQKKFESHCMGHGNPDLECNECHKVFASKFTLRTHRRIHARKFNCVYCTKAFTTQDDLRSHTQSVHNVYLCDVCGFVANKNTDLGIHTCFEDDKTVLVSLKEPSETDYAESLLDEGISESDIMTLSPDQRPFDLEEVTEHETLQKADDIIAKVMSNKMFLMNSKKSRRHNKVCDVCFKKFDRMGDLKRHLIEHVIHSTLAKTPVSKQGTLNIQCEVCQQETFTKIDKYKAHLREHAKLTIYRCTFCDKSFSDSSNFSKHKKIHSTSYFQCDLCQRKFNSKKMIAQHMEYHKKNSPLPCEHCGKVFYFESKLNKHIKLAHTKEFTTKFRCRFCPDFFKSLKEKWDHEWHIHNVRSFVIDCLVCGLKFRKYSELKRHCSEIHDMDIPKAKEIMKK